MKKKQGMMEKKIRVKVYVIGSAWTFRTIFLKAPHIIAKSCAACNFTLKLPDP